MGGLLTHHDGAGPEDDQQLAGREPQHLRADKLRPLPARAAGAVGWEGSSRAFRRTRTTAAVCETAAMRGRERDGVGKEVGRAWGN